MIQRAFLFVALAGAPLTAQSVVGYTPSNAERQKAAEQGAIARPDPSRASDRKSTRLNSSH